MKKSKIFIILPLLLIAVLLNQSIAQDQTVRLACVTAAHRYENNQSILEIVSQRNSQVSGASAVFETVFDLTLDSPVEDALQIVSEEGIPENATLTWGLRCRDGWVNTGCSASIFGNAKETSTGAPYDSDIVQRDNGCFSDNDEFENQTLYVTCCRTLVVAGGLTGTTTTTTSTSTTSTTTTTTTTTTL